MIKKLIRVIGTTAFWLSWPLLYVYLRRAERTRVLLKASDKVLLVQTWHGPGDWSLPGGGIHKNEEKTLAAVRELVEETTITLGIEQLRPLGTKNHTEHGLVFTCHYFVGEFTQPLRAKACFPEVLEARWVSLNELSEYRLAPDARYALSASGTLLQ